MPKRKVPETIDPLDIVIGELFEKYGLEKYPSLVAIPAAGLKTELNGGEEVVSALNIVAAAGFTRIELKLTTEYDYSMLFSMELEKGGSRACLQPQ